VKLIPEGDGMLVEFVYGSSWSVIVYYSTALAGFMYGVCRWGGHAYKLERTVPDTERVLEIVRRCAPSLGK
jgi:hypothetical protein